MRQDGLLRDRSIGRLGLGGGAGRGLGGQPGEGSVWHTTALDIPSTWYVC